MIVGIHIFTAVHHKTWMVSEVGPVRLPGRDIAKCSAIASV